MKKILFITDYLDRFLQNKHRFDSLDVKLLVKLLEDKEYDVKCITYNELINYEKDVKDHFIIYTASQMEQYKNYIENIMYFLKDDNELIPKYEILKSHENKFFQELMNRKNNIPTNIRAYLFGDIKEYEEFAKKKILPYPQVIKGINGSASMNVTVANSYDKAIKAIKGINKNMVEGMNKDMPIKYNLFPKENLSNRQFVVQEYIDLPMYDYRIHIMGDRYFGHKRTILESGGLTSGSDSINDYECDLPDVVLDYAKDIFDKIDTPHVILDVVHIGSKLHLIEWSGIHLGCISLLNGKRYYKKEEGTWKKYEKIPSLEEEYVYSWEWYIKNRLGE